MVLRNEDGSIARTVDEIAAAKERQKKEEEEKKKSGGGGGSSGGSASDELVSDEISIDEIDEASKDELEAIEESDARPEKRREARSQLDKRQKETEKSKSSESSDKEKEKERDVTNKKEIEDQLEKVAREDEGRTGREAGEALEQIREHNYNPQLALKDKERLLQDDRIDDKVGRTVATGDPGEGEDVRSVGRGDTREEARRSAARNPKFDADADTPVGEMEREMGTNQPLQNIEGSRPEAVQKRLEEIAGSDRFRGDRMGREAGAAAQAISEFREQYGDVELEQTDEGLQIRGQEQPQDPAQRNAENRDLVQQATPQNVYQQQNQQEQDAFDRNEKLTDIETLVDPTRGNPDADLTEELTTAGVDLIGRAGEFGDQVGEAIQPGNAKNLALDVVRDVAPETENRDEVTQMFEDYWPEAPAQTSDLEKGLASISPVASTVDDAVQGEEPDQEDLEQLAAIQSPVTTETELDRREDLTGGVASGPGSLAGLGVSSAGAVPRAARQTASDIEESTDQEVFRDWVTEDNDSPGLVEGAAAGPGLVAEQAAENPGEFAAEEIGEEIGEAAAGALIAGPAGAAATAGTPTPTPEATTTPDPNLVSQAEAPLTTRNPSRPEIPSAERLPDLGEQSIGRDIQGVQRDPASQVLGENLLQDELAQPEPGREAGVPEDRPGFTEEELDVLERRREQRPGVEEVNTEVRSISDPEAEQVTAEDVKFEQVGDELIVEETFDAGQFMGVGLRGPEVTVERPEVNPDPGSVSPDQTRRGRVETETDTEINIFEERTQPDPRLDTTPEQESSLSVDEGLNNPIIPEVGEDSLVGQGQGQEQQPDEEVVPQEEQEIISEITSQEQSRAENERGPNPQPETEPIFGEERRLEPEPERRLERRRDPDLPDRDNQEDDEQILGSGSDQLEGGTGFAPSLEGLAFGVESDVDPDDPGTFTGLEARGVPTREQPDQDNRDEDFRIL